MPIASSFWQILFTRVRGEFVLANFVSRSEWRPPVRFGNFVVPRFIRARQGHERLGQTGTQRQNKIPGRVPRIEIRGYCTPRNEFLGCRGADCPPSRAKIKPRTPSLAHAGGQSSRRQARIEIQGHSSEEMGQGGLRHISE